MCEANDESPDQRRGQQHFPEGLRCSRRQLQGQRGGSAELDRHYECLERAEMSSLKSALFKLFKIQFYICRESSAENSSVEFPHLSSRIEIG